MSEIGKGDESLCSTNSEGYRKSPEEFVFTKEYLQDLYNIRVKSNEDRTKWLQEEQIHSEVSTITREIFSVNGDGHKTCTMYVYKRDKHFATDIADILCKKFPGSIVTVNYNTIWRLFNYCAITVTW